MTNILYFHGVVRDDSSSVDTNSEVSTERDDQDGSGADLVGKNLSKLGSISTFAKNCLKFGRSFDRGSSSSGVNGSGASIIGNKTGTSRSSETLPFPRSEGVTLSSPCLKVFTFTELKNATRNFGLDNLVGEGGFGSVFKGWLDEHTLVASRPGSGMAIAVKKHNTESLQGHKEWLAEVNYLGCFLHQNLIRLIGYCLEGENRLLVYEFMPKGSLDNHLFKRGASTLPWEIRIKVAIGAARVLSFLHNLDVQVIHRNIHTSNILLDVEFNAKLSDFELARAGPTGDATHVSTRVMGTFGYAAPEYVATGRLTAKSDVYSFGVVLLELLSGRRAIDKTRSSVEQNLVDWAKPYLGGKQRKLLCVMDGRLEGQYPKKGASMIAALALRCLSNDANDRPTMSETLTILQQISDDANNTSRSQ